MFRGAFEHSLDEKGRITIPHRLRLALGESFIVTKGFDGCLFVYPLETWRQLDQALAERPLLERHAVTLSRFLSSQAADVAADAQGRVAIPAGLREYAGLEREVIIVGAGSRIEVWSRDRWEEYNQRMSEAALMEAAAALGLA